MKQNVRLCWLHLILFNKVVAFQSVLASTSPTHATTEKKGFTIKEIKGNPTKEQKKHLLQLQLSSRDRSTFSTSSTSGILGD